MKVGIVAEDESGFKGNVCAHFGQCKFFFLVDIHPQEKRVIGSKVVSNTAIHGGGGCLAVDEILSHKVTHVIAGGMGLGAQQKLAAAGVKVYGYTGNTQKAIDDLMANVLTGLGSCKGENPSAGCC